MGTVYAKFFSILFFILCYSNCFSQIISGVVLDGKSNQPLQGASIYFDNTTIGVISDAQGKFEIEGRKGLKTNLVISFIGYKTLMLNNFELQGRSSFYLYESKNVLGEVVLDVKNGWSRELKLKEFKKHYLGESKNGLSCEIINEEDIILKYNLNTRKLTAKARNPILIKNNNLKYLVSVDLRDFEVHYTFVSRNKKNLRWDEVYYSGAIFFKPIDIEPSKSTAIKRKNSFFGSYLHFMRSLASEKLIKNGYKIYKEGIPIITRGTTEDRERNYIKVVSVDGMNEVKIIIEGRVEVLYKDQIQSSLESFAPVFYIDNYGNHSPADKVRFGGDFGEQRIGDILPLDFLLAE